MQNQQQPYAAQSQQYMTQPNPKTQPSLQQNKPYSTVKSGNNWGISQTTPITSQWNQPMSNNILNPQKQLTPAERIEMITEIYKTVLGREPSTRDINYYKYSTLKREQIQDKLLKSDEHTNLIEQGAKYPQAETELNTARARIQKLENQIRDELEEFKKLISLLKEKNRCIEQLRIQKSNRYAIPKYMIEQKPQRESSQDISDTTNIVEINEQKQSQHIHNSKVKSRRSLTEKIRDILSK